MAIVDADGSSLSGFGRVAISYKDRTVLVSPWTPIRCDGWTKTLYI